MARGLCLIHLFYPGYPGDSKGILEKLQLPFSLCEYFPHLFIQTFTNTLIN